MKYKCIICEKIIKKQSKELIALCKVHKIGSCSIECYNEWEVENKFKEKEISNE